MKTVAIFGKNISVPVAGAIAGAVKDFGCMLLSDQRVEFPPNGFPKYTVIGLKSVPVRLCTDGVIILESGVFIPEGVEFEGNLTAVVGQDDVYALDILKRNNIPTVTCGMSPMSTVTLSGRNDNSAAVCIGRSINRIPPGECILKFNRSYDDFSLMSTAAALMLVKGYREIYKLP